MHRILAAGTGGLLALILSVGAGDCLAQQSLLPSARGSSDEWAPSTRSLSEFLAAGYELVSVVAPSPQTRLYFLQKPGMIARCKEEASPATPPTPPQMKPGQTTLPDPAALKPVTMKTTFECRELNGSAVRQ